MGHDSGAAAIGGTGTFSFGTKEGRVMKRIPCLAVVFACAAGLLASAENLPLPQVVLAQIDSIERDKVSRTTTEQKVDSQLIYATRQRLVGSAVPGAPDLRPDVVYQKDGRVMVDLTATVSQDLLAAITAAGGSVLGAWEKWDSVRAVIPIEAAKVLAARPDVRFVARAAEAVTNTGSVNGEGDTTHRAGFARTLYGVNGAGIQVGALSDSSDFLAAAQGSGDLGAVTVLAGQSGTTLCAPNPTCTGEGTAMLEIIADIAPGAGLFFATGFNGPAGMATNIQGLATAGCNVIVDDVTYFNESPFQDGPIAQAVNTVSAAGVLYFSSARNSGNLNDGTSSTWEGDFVDGGPVATGRGGQVHSFGAQTFNVVNPGGSQRRIDLFWADPQGGANNDYDVYRLNSTGTTVLASSTNTQNGTQAPYESIGGVNAPVVGDRIVIVRFAGVGRFLHLDIGRGRLSIPTAGCVRGHNASGAANAFSVAATDVANSPGVAFVGGATNPVETFSSDGPRRMFFDPAGNAFTPGDFSATGGIVLQKPDITAADGAAGVTPGFNPFFGTSAAAPHAAAIAALAWSSNVARTPAQIRTALQSTALDIEAPGFDRDSGSGIVMAFGALKSLNPCTLTCPANKSTTNDPNQCGAVVSYTAPTTVGTCGTVSCDVASGAFDPVGTTTVNCTSASEDRCSFTITVTDAQPPNITCPANVTANNDPGLCSAVVNYPAPTVSDNCPGVGAPACAPPSGSVFQKGATPVNCSVADQVGTSAACRFSVTVRDVEPPRVACALQISQLWPPNHTMRNVGLAASAVDNCPGPLPLTVAVFGDEDDETQTGDGRFSPDARDIATDSLRLRAERIGGIDGRVYLDRVSTVDTSGNPGWVCCTNTVPLGQSYAWLTSIEQQAQAAKAYCDANGTAPPAFVVVGDGLVIGNKQ